MNVPGAAPATPERLWGRCTLARHLRIVTDCIEVGRIGTSANAMKRPGPNRFKQTHFQTMTKLRLQFVGGT